MSLVLFIREFPYADVLLYWVHPKRGGFVYLAYPKSGYGGPRLIIDREENCFCYGQNAAMAAKASAFSLLSLGMCSSFHAEKLAKRCLTRGTYFIIQGSRDSYSAFTCPNTNWKSLLIISLSTDIATANSIPTRMALYSDSLFEALKPRRIACSILSPPEDFNCKPMLASIC